MVVFLNSGIIWCRNTSEQNATLTHVAAHGLRNKTKINAVQIFQNIPYD